MTDRDVPQSPFPSRHQLHQHDAKVFAADDVAPRRREDAHRDQPAADPTAPRRREDAHRDQPAADPAPPARPVPTPEAAPPSSRIPRAPDSATLFPGSHHEPDDTSSGLRSRRLEKERQRARARRRGRRIRTAVILVLIVAAIGVGVWYAWGLLQNSTITTPQSDDYPGPGTGEVAVTVESGDTGSDIGARLVDQDVVKSVGAFVRAFDANQASTSIQPGTYTLMQQMSASQAVAALLDDANRTDNTVTVLPGQTADQVVQKMEEVAGFPAEDIASAMEDSEAIDLPEETGGTVEGWLFPGTYEVGTNDTPESLFAQMIAATVKELDSLGVAPEDRQTVLTKASILEREMNIPEYLPQVARVIENRLDEPEGETRGFLQMDSTVLYGVGKTGGIPTSDDLADDNPYNTYVHTGLPPTPIGQPGQEAVQATLEPADGDWLYFVTVDLDTGETLFATTLEEQEANIEKLTAYCSDNPGKCTS